MDTDIPDPTKTSFAEMLDELDANIRRIKSDIAGDDDYTDQK